MSNTSAGLSNKNNLQEWLQSINCLQLFTPNDILSGNLIQSIIKKILPTIPSSFQQISTSNSTLTRVSNWNTITNELKEHFNIIISQQNKSKIVNGNQQLVIEILAGLKQHHSKKQKSTQVDLSQIDIKKDLNQTKSLLQMLLILIMKNFHLSSKQSVALLSNESKYLAHILTKGLKGQFKGIQAFLIQMSRYITKIIQFCKTNNQNIVFFLRSIKPALISKSDVVSSLCMFNVFNVYLVNYQLSERMEIFETHLLSTYLLAIKRHPHLEEAIIQGMLDRVVGGEKGNNKSNSSGIKNNNNNTVVNQWRGKFLDSVLNCLGSDSERFGILLSMIKILGQKDALKQWISIKIFAKKIENAIQSIKKEQQSLTCINIVIALNEYCSQIWSLSDNHQQNVITKGQINGQQLSQTLIQNLKSLQLINLTSHLTFIHHLFTLLQQFGRNKHFIAPTIYKLIIQKFVQLENNQVDKKNFVLLLQVYLKNFQNIIQEFPSIPWNTILQTIFQIFNSKSDNNNKHNVVYTQNQLSFLLFLLDSPSMDIKYALMIFDTLSKLFIETAYLSGLATKIMVKVIQLFGKTEQIVEQLSLKMIKLCLAIHHANFKKLSHKRKSVTGDAKLSAEDALSKVKNNAIQFFILKTVQVHVQGINSKVQPLVAFSYIQMKDRPEFLKGLKKILDAIGNSNQIISKYEKEIKKSEDEAKQAKQKEKQQKQRIQKQKVMSSRLYKKQKSVDRYDQNSALVNKNDTFDIDLNPIQPYVRRAQKQSVSMHTKLNNSLNASSFLGVTDMAQKGIQKYQKVYLQKIQKEDLQKIRKKQQEQKFEQMKKYYKKKMLSQGIQIKGEVQEIQYLFEFDSQQNLILEKHFKKVAYYTNESEQDCDMKAVQKLLKSYQKSLKLIFSIYSGQKKGFLPQNFDQVALNTVVISSSNLFKFLKDFSFEDYITLKEVQYLTQKVNIEMKATTADYQAIDFNGFIEFIKQASFLMFTRPPKDLRGQPLAKMLEQTFSNLKLFAAQNKINDKIFEEPDNIFFNETEAVAELNRKLEKNPDYILPQGYKKIVDKKINFEYKIYLEAMSETYKVVFQVVDQLLYKILGIHTMEPFTKEQKVTKARPALFVAQRLKLDVMPAKHIPVRMKKQIAKIPIVSRPLAKQCAIVLDQIIEAIQLGHSQVGQKHLNKVQLDRKKKQQQQRKKYYLQKSKRQGRNRLAKTAIEQHKLKKQQQDKQMSLKKQQAQKKLLQQKQKKQKQEKQLKKKIQEYAKRKKQQEEQKLKKKKQQEEKQKKQRQRLKLLNDQTLKKIQEEKKKKQEEQSAKKKQKEKQEKLKKEAQKKKLEQSQLMKKQMVQDFKMRKSTVKDSASNGLNKEGENKSSTKNLQSYKQQDNSPK